MLLTRSPLSPGPKPWFSLDLHVLSAPPAFVLSQDQTLRESGLPASRQAFTLSLVLKGQGSRRTLTRLRPLPSAASGGRSRVSTFHAVEFSKTDAADGVKKPPTRAEAYGEAGTGRIRFGREASNCLELQDLATPPVWAAGE